MACGCRDVIALLFIDVGLSKVATYGNDPMGTRHLQLEVSVVEDKHELGIAWSPQDSVVAARPPKVTGRSICPRRTTYSPGMTLWNGAPDGRMTANDSPMAS